MGARIRVDVGGTFTDVALLDDARGRLHLGKVPTTPRDPSLGALAGLREILDATGARPLVLRRHRRELAERVLHDGRVARPLDLAPLAAILDDFRRAERCPRGCRMGASYVCYQLKILGVDVDGGLREYYPVPADRLLPVPDALGDDQAALIEPLAVATHDVTRAGVRAGDAVMVFGGGPIGTLIALVSRHRGARVIVSEVNPYRVEMLGQLGLDTAGPGADPVKLANQWTNGEGVDVAFEVSGHPAAARAMTDVVRVWGTVSIVAIHAEPIPVNLYQMFARELAMHGSRLYTHAAWEEAIRLAATGAVRVAPLVSRVVPLGDLQEGMEAALGGGPVMKVLVDVTR